MNRAAISDPSFAVEAKNLTSVLGGQKVLDVEHFTVNPNEVMMIIGPNGSGKSTLLMNLALLYQPTSGTVFYRGVPVRDSHEILVQRRRLAVVLQEPLLLNSSVMENVTLGLKLRKVDRHEIRPRARKWLEQFGIAALEKRQARTLSGGEARRVSLARAFALEPEVLYLDEPFIALDAPTRQSLLEDFESVVRETKTTVVMVTHDRNEAIALGDRIAIIMNGQIRQVGTPTEVFTSPVDEEVAGFVEVGNILRGIVESQNEGLALIRVGEKQIQASTDLAVGLKVNVILPYDDVTIMLPTAEMAVSSARNRLKGEVLRVFPTGSQAKVTIDCGFTLVGLVTRRSAEDMGLEKGKQVYVSFKAVSVHVMLRHSEDRSPV